MLETLAEVCKICELFLQAEVQRHHRCRYHLDMLKRLGWVGRVGKNRSNELARVVRSASRRGQSKSGETCVPSGSV